MNRSRLQVAKADILKRMDEAPHVLHAREIAQILTQERAGWRLAQRTTVADFIAFLIKSGSLKRLEFPFSRRAETVYSWGEVGDYDVLQNLKPGVYFSHYTALKLHGLTEQVPKTIYLTDERAHHGQESIAHPVLNQSAIDAAFVKAPRISQNEVSFRGRTVVLLNGAATDHLGVELMDVNDQRSAGSVRVRVTGLERTLIDAAVRPFYCGGTAEVMKAFQSAAGTASANTVQALLKQLNFIYPYHQVLGYYLEIAGYSSNVIRQLHKLPMPRRFYLTHGMKTPQFIERWQLYVPAGYPTA